MTKRIFSEEQMERLGLYANPKLLIRIQEVVSRAEREQMQTDRLISECLGGLPFGTFNDDNDLIDEPEYDDEL